MMVVMIRIITRIGIVALLTCVSALGTVADDNYVYANTLHDSANKNVRLKSPVMSAIRINANDTSKMSIDKRRLDFFNWQVESALRDFNGYPPIRSYQRARHSLRRAFIRIGSNEIIYLRRQDFSIQDTAAGFLDLYDKMAQWAEEIILMDGAEVFRLHKYYRLARGGYKHRSLSQSLFELAVEKKHPAALWERFYDYLLKSKSESNVCSAEGILKELYSVGNYKAANELARRYKDGDKFVKDRARAVYWYAKALELKGEVFVTQIMIDLGREFTEMDKYWLHFWRRSEVPPRCLTEPR